LRDIKTGRFLKDKSIDLRLCFACGSNETYIDRRGVRIWFSNEPTDLYLCKKCYAQYFDNPVHHPLYTHKRIQFKNKQIALKENPRKGICDLCGKKNGDQYINKKNRVAIVNTQIHHLEYDEAEPLAHTIELCESCHTSESWRLGQIRPDLVF